MADARRSNMDGVAMVVSDIGYMKWKRFLVKHGFEAVDVAPPCYELMALRFGDIPWPKFSGDWEKKARACGKGVTILKTSQCPYFEDATVALQRIAERKKIPAKVIELKTARDVRQLAPSPYGTYNVVIDGQAVPSHDQARAALLAHGK